MMVLDFLKDRLKNFFPKELDKEEVKVTELLQWYTEKSSIIIKELNNMVYERYNLLNEELSSLSQALTKLETAEIKDPDKIEHKVKQVVLDNRANYVRQLGHFIKSIDVPSDFDHNSATVFCNALTEQLNELSRSTQKSYYTAQHLFFKEVEEVVKVIKNIDKQIKEIQKQIGKSNIIIVEDTKRSIIELMNKHDIKSNIKSEQDNKRNERKDTVKKRNALMKQIISLERSEEYVNYIHLKENKNMLDKDFNAVKDYIYGLFSPLDRAFRKFARITVFEEKMLNKYIEDPLNALLSDSELVITAILENLKKNIDSGSIELKGKEKDKIMVRINEITPELLSEEVEHYKKLEKGNEELKQKFDGMEIIDERSALEKELQQQNSRLEQLDAEIKELDKKTSIDFNQLELDIKERIKKTVNVDVGLINEEPKEQPAESTATYE